MSEVVATERSGFTTGNARIPSLTRPFHVGDTNTDIDCVVSAVISKKECDVCSRRSRAGHANERLKAHLR